MRSTHHPALARLNSRRLYSSSRIVKENDVLFLRQRGEKSPKWHLTTPLRPDSRVKLSYGASLKGSDFIGKNILDTVKDHKGRDVVLHAPSMASYIINSARMATPIYPHDAATIVSLLDFNLSRPGEEDDESSPAFEVFEAGTGMGSLTLHLARALHAANPAVSPSLRKALTEAQYQRDCFGLDLSPEDQAALDAYLPSRRAILHTLDRNPKHSRAAHKLIRNFRRALYFPNIDFHVGSIEEYISTRLAETHQAPFLSHAILDLPAADENADLVIKAMHPNAQLIIFNPSISQIADFQAWAMRTQQPVRLERVLELPVSTTADGVKENGGGKEWDVKTVIPRGEEAEGKMVQVMRPKVGDRVAGGGFVAVLRRWPIQETGGQTVDEHIVSKTESLTQDEDSPVEELSEEPARRA
ncbi:Fc.00g003820.m01.CDS01 [Cosmosporella sp. VM-42]